MYKSPGSLPNAGEPQAFRDHYENIYIPLVMKLPGVRAMRYSFGLTSPQRESMQPLHAAPYPWCLAQIRSQREFRIPAVVATWSRHYGSRAGRRLDRGRYSGGRLVLVGGRHRGSDPRSNQPVGVLGHRA